MTKSELKTGMLVQTRDGDVGAIVTGKQIGRAHV